MGIGSIQISEIHAYMQMFGIDDLGQRATLLRRIQILDAAYLDYYNDKHKKDVDKKKKAKQSPKR